MRILTEDGTVGDLLPDRVKTALLYNTYPRRKAVLDAMGTWREFQDFNVYDSCRLTDRIVQDKREDKR